MRILIFPVLAFACASGEPAAAAPSPAGPAPASPAPASPGPSTAAACPATGPVLFEVDHRSIPGAKQVTSTTRVFATGAWTVESADADGKAQPARSGCIAKPDVKQLATGLHSAPWKVSTARIRCMAVATDFTVFQVDGREVFTQKLCSGQSLDDKSKLALDTAVTQVDSAVGKTP